MCYFDISDMVPIIAILASVAVSYFSIRYSTKTSKVNYIFQEMVKCLEEKLYIFIKLRNALHLAANGAIITDAQTGNRITTGRERYWEILKSCSDKSNQLISRAEIHLPLKLQNCSNDVAKMLNECRNHVKQNNKKSNDEINKLLDDIDSKMRIFINEIRKHVGTDEITLISKKDNEFLLYENQ